MRTAIAAPRASALIESMRDIGYSLGTALADVIDNSIAASATSIQILTEDDEFRRIIAIADNGKGMSGDQLLEAMRPGSHGPLVKRGKTDLGRFGLGLKTASFSQCRRVTVISRKDGEISAAIWDLDHVSKTDLWELLIPDEPAELPFADRIDKHGTVVIWENLDRLDGADSTQASTSDINERLSDALSHLELVFHRFMSKEGNHRKVTFSANGRELVPFDPFASDNPATIVGPCEQIKAGNDVITVQSFTLPHHRKISRDRWRQLEGSEGHLRNQGFYVYRGRRLIVHATWFGLARQQELTKLSRVRVDLPNTLDAEWKLDIRKASAVPPAVVRNRLRRIVDELGATSKRVYTSRGARLISDNPVPVWDRLQDKGQITYQLNRNHPLFNAARSTEKGAEAKSLEHVLQLIESSMPYDAIYSDFGQGNENLVQAPASRELIATDLLHTVAEMDRLGLPRAQLKQYLSFGEPFRSNWETTLELLGEMNVEQS